MKPFPNRGLTLAGTVMIVATWVLPVDAQLYQVVPPRRYRTSSPSTTPDAASSDTRISLEIFTGSEGVGFHAQQWESVFEHAGVLGSHPSGILRETRSQSGRNNTASSAT